MLAKVLSSAVIGLDPVPIEVEVDIAAMGLPGFTIVGLPDKAVEEAKERVRAAIKNSGADFPAKRITVNLAPSDIPKEGTQFDLAIALGILIASGQIETKSNGSLVLGELSLDGAVRAVAGVFSMASLANQKKITDVFVPVANANEAGLVSKLTSKPSNGPVQVYPVASLLSLHNHFSNHESIAPHEPEINFSTSQSEIEIDLADIKGQEQAKRAMEISAAGGHNLLMNGSPGAGKTMLARAMLSILPHLTLAESFEVTKIYSICGLLKPNEPLIHERPFRSPHHTVSQIGLIGGGSKPKPGEISLAHRGVLFLDEFPQFAKTTIDALRAPLEDGQTTIVRASQALTFPSKFILVAAQNPCPCGFLGDPEKTCTCTPSQISRYKKRLSGPILDRIDLHITVPRVPTDKLVTNDEVVEDSKTVRKRVQKARDRQTKRFLGTPITANAEMRASDIKKYCALDTEGQALLAMAVVKLHLSARAYHKIIKVARTIADLDAQIAIQKTHVAEAISYRQQEI